MQPFYSNQNLKVYKTISRPYKIEAMRICLAACSYSQ